MFLNEPSGVSGQYGTVAKRVGNKIFKTSDKLIMYYVSALTWCKVESYFKLNILDKKYRRCRFHAMMLFRIIVAGLEMPKFNQRKMESYCNKLLDILQDDEICEQVFKGIVGYIISIGKEIDIDNRKCFEKKETTDFLITEDSISNLKAYFADSL